ncbi:hypothetical protein [Shewanella sp. HN-41]|nr:hypothetical protein [Shewanella sp. HN-41]EGM71908.1 hypothetical protein SOHN41_00097 [Shewanella sp. HN-41]
MGTFLCPFFIPQQSSAIVDVTVCDELNMVETVHLDTLPFLLLA